MFLRVASFCSTPSISLRLVELGVNHTFSIPFGSVVRVGADVTCPDLGIACAIVRLPSCARSSAFISMAKCNSRFLASIFENPGSATGRIGCRNRSRKSGMGQSRKRKRRLRRTLGKRSRIHLSRDLQILDHCHHPCGRFRTVTTRFVVPRTAVIGRLSVREYRHLLC